jgi:hypothetical protein
MDNETAEKLKRRAEHLKWEADNLDYEAKDAPYHVRDFIYQKVRDKHDEANAILQRLKEAGY